MVNTVPDFRPFDLAIQNGPGLSVASATSRQRHRRAHPRVYGLSFLRRHAEELVDLGQGLSGGELHLYAIGTLTRDDIELVVTRDSF
jgi:hypothetical protein